MHVCVHGYNLYKPVCKAVYECLMILGPCANKVCTTVRACKTRKSHKTSETISVLIVEPTREHVTYISLPYIRVRTDPRKPTKTLQLQNLV